MDGQEALYESDPVFLSEVNYRYNGDYAADEPAYVQFIFTPDFLNVTVTARAPISGLPTDEAYIISSHNYVLPEELKDELKNLESSDSNNPKVPEEDKSSKDEHSSLTSQLLSDSKKAGLDLTLTSAVVEEKHGAAVETAVPTGLFASLFGLITSAGGAAVLSKKRKD